MPPVPFPSADLNATAVTPNRHSSIVFGMPEYRKVTDGCHLYFAGSYMASPSGQPSGGNINVELLPSGSWCIASWEMQMQFERLEATGNAILPPGATSPPSGYPPGAENALAHGYASFVSAGTIPGVTYDASAGNPSPFARKRKAASDDWHAELTADKTAFVGPLLPTQNVPMRRVANFSGPGPGGSGPGPYGINQPVYLRFLGPASPLSTTDAFLTFYFGGDVSATAWPDPAVTVNGGNFCIVLYGDGHLELYERTNKVGTTLFAAEPWRFLDTWQWEVPAKIAGQQHLICILPEGHDTLNFVGKGQHHVFVADSRKCGYSFKTAMTGAGGLRLDLREDLRIPFQYGRQTFPTGGSLPPLSSESILFGYPFNIPFRMAASTKIVPAMDGKSEPGTSFHGVVITLFDAKTNEVLPAGTGGSFLTLHASQRAYYPQYAFQSPDNQHTPFLRGCGFKVDGTRALFTPTAYTAGQLMEIAITGPDVEIDCDTANVLLEDDLAFLAAGPPGQGGLEQHAEIHCQVQTTWDPADLTKNWVLFDGTLVKAAGARSGRDLGYANQYPANAWKTWRLMLAGPWYRLNQDWMRAWAGGDFSHDHNAAFVGPPVNDYPPWQIVDIIKELLRQAGFDDSQMRILNPDGTTGPNGPRLYANGKDPANQFVMPNQPVGTVIQRLLDDYLGAKLIWDKEAKPHGRWLTVYPPPYAPTYATLFTFRTSGPPVTTGTPLLPVHMPAAWPAGTGFVANYTTWVKPPEANLFIVATAPVAPVPARDPRMAGGEDIRYVKDGACASMAIGVNWRSTYFAGYPDPDPTSLDWVPYGVKPRILIDSSLAIDGNIEKSNENCRFRCRREMNAAAYGLRYFEWLAPLVAYFDPDPVYAGGPRTFRTYDLVTFNEDGTLYNVLVTNCNPQIGLPEGDLCQWAHHQGYALPVPLSY